MSFLPGVLAHASQITYRFPLPTWIYIVAAGLIVLVSAPAAAAFMGRGPGLGWRSRNLYPRLRPLHLGAIGLTISSLLLVWCLLGGVAARTSEEAHEFLENPATILIWVDFWVGLGIVSALVGNIWDFVSPLSALARAIDRELGRREVGRRLYPERLGQWPAVALLLVWSWFELVWEPAKEPDKLALLVVGYFVLTLAGAGVFGADVWLANCEVFTVFARTLARCAPLELDPAEPEDWLDAEPDSACGPAPALRRRPGLDAARATGRRRVRDRAARDRRLRRLLPDARSSGTPSSGSTTALASSARTPTCTRRCSWPPSCSPSSRRSCS